MATHRIAVANDTAPLTEQTNVPNSNPNNIDCAEQQLKWRSKAKSELIATSRINMMKRLTKIVYAVTSYSALFSSFEINKSEIRRMLNDVDNAINSWRGVDFTSCKKTKNSFKEYKVTATNWFNRNKAKIYGNYFFCPLIFKYVLSYCRNIPNAQLSDSKRMELFISIFLLIFDGKITFARTKAQPLMPYQTLIQPNEFRQKCKELILFYDLTWNQNEISPSKIHRKYQKDKCRSNKIFKSFIECLKSIELILLSPQTAHKYAFFSAHTENNTNLLPGTGLHCDAKTNLNANHFVNSRISVRNEPKNTANRSPVSMEAEVANDGMSNNSVANLNDVMSPQNNGLSQNMNNLIQFVLSQGSNNAVVGNNNVCAPNNNYVPHNSPFALSLAMPQTQINMNNFQINNLNLNGNLVINNQNNNNGVRVRYQLLSIHPNLPPIIISQNVV